MSPTLSQAVAPDQTQASAVNWHALAPAEVASHLQVDPARGLTAAEAQQRLQQYGPNRLAKKPKEPGWKAFLRQYRDLMQIILVVTGLVSLIALQDTRTFTMLIILAIFNAVLGMHQEAKAAASLASLQGMMQLQARVRRDGQVSQVPADERSPATTQPPPRPSRKSSASRAARSPARSSRP